MNKKIVSGISVLLALACFSGAVEIVTRYRLDLLKVPVLKTVKTDRSLIAKSDIVIRSYPRKYIDEGAILNQDELVDTYVTLNHTLYPGIPILKSHVESLSLSHDDAILRLHENQSVFALKTDLKQSFGGMLNVGHRVDVSLVIRDRSGVSTAHTFLKQVRVIGAKNKNAEDVNVGDIPSVILLAVNNEALESLLQYQVDGDLVMTLVEKDADRECVLEDVNLE